MSGCNSDKKEFPIVGDDIKRQIGATITHRTLANLFKDRGVKAGQDLSD